MSFVLSASRRWRRPPRHRRGVTSSIHQFRVFLLFHSRRRGKFEWAGAWSDADPRWTPEFKDKVAASIGVDAAEIIKSGGGAFWMAYEDFVRYFAKFSVAVAVVAFI